VRQDWRCADMQADVTWLQQGVTDFHGSSGPGR